MTRPKYEVGEEVILQSQSNPELNGRCVVLAVLFHGEKTTCPVTRGVVQNGSDSLGYVLDDGGIGDSGFCILWDESALRKRHIKANMTWEGLKEAISGEISGKEYQGLGGGV